MNKGSKHTEQIRKQISNSLKGHKGYWLGKKFTIEHRKKIGLKGEKNSMYGKKHSQKSIEKMKQSWKKRKPMTLKTREKISLALSKRIIKESTREKLRICKSGDKCYFWKGGISKKNDLIRKSLKYRLWREKVFKRDDWTCQVCYCKGNKLHPHHIKSFSKFPKLRFIVKNGLTLCESCHRKTDSYGKNL